MISAYVGSLRRYTSDESLATSDHFPRCSLLGLATCLTDAASHSTSYTYDNMDRVQTRTDPLLRQESNSYDLNGNLLSSTDRKNQVTGFTYDALNRPTLVGFNMI